jgi:hypothetical protein
MKLAARFYGCLWILVAASCSQGQSNDPGCEAERQKMAALVSSEKDAAPIAQFRAYLRFLDAAPEEPADCVHRDLRGRIGEVETRLVSLVIGNERMRPWKVLHCEGIDPQTKKCEGLEADDTALIPETKLLAPKASINGAASVRVLMEIRYEGTILEALGGSRSLLQDTQVPFKLPFQGSSVDIAQLKQYRDPVLILVVRRKDSLHTRKFVWYLAN